MDLQKDLLLTTAGDLVIGSNGDVSITDSVAQAIRIRLRWFAGEWRFNPELGVPYFEDVLIKKVSISHVERIMTEEILDVDGVLKVRSVTITTNSFNRTMLITFEAETAEGIINEEVSINV